MGSSKERPAETQMLNTYCFILKVLVLTQKVNIGGVLRTHLVQNHPFMDGALRPREGGTFPMS